MKQSERIIAIADIHGCLNEFKALLKQIDPDPEYDTLIILGDVIDRGYDSVGVIQTLLDLQETFGERLIWLLGNHEDEVIRRNRKKSFFHKKEPDPLGRYARLFSELPLFHECAECFFVHAGFDGDDKDRELILNDRSVLNGERIYQDRLYIAGHSPFYNNSAVPFDQPVYIDDKGTKHTLKNGMRLPQKGAVFIDTGCVYKNRLSALIIDQDAVIQIISVPFAGI